MTSICPVTARRIGSNGSICNQIDPVHLLCPTVQSLKARQIFFGDICSLDIV
jgi:hypothetical protein